MQIRFTNFPSPDCPAKFIELEDDNGHCIRGKWIEDDDTVLLIPPNDYGLTPAQYHAGLDKLWDALLQIGIEKHKDFRMLDVFTLAAEQLLKLKT